MANIVYTQATGKFGDGSYAWKASGGTIFKATLLGTGYTPNVDHDTIADIGANELAVSRVTLTLQDKSIDDTLDLVKYLFSNTLSFASIPAIVRYCLIVKENTPDSTTELVFCNQLTSDVGSGLTLQLTCNAAGLFTTKNV